MPNHADKFTVADQDRLGCVLGESDDAYHGAPAIQRTKLEDFRANAAEFKGRWIDGTIPKRKETDAFKVGRALHCLANEGFYPFTQKFVTLPEDAPNKPTKAQLNADKKSDAAKKSIDFWTMFSANTVGKTVIDKEDMDMVLAMHKRIEADPIVSQLIKGCKGEVTWRKHLPHFGFTVQCKTDLVNDKGHELTGGRPYILDIKTMLNLTRSKYGVPRNFRKVFQREMEDFGYHRQDAFYTSVVDLVHPEEWDFLFVAISKAPGHDIAIVQPDDDARAMGRKQIAQDLKALSEAFQTDTWPGIPSGIHRIGLSGYYLKDNE